MKGLVIAVGRMLLQFELETGNLDAFVRWIETGNDLNSAEKAERAKWTASIDTLIMGLQPTSTTTVASVAQIEEVEVMAERALRGLLLECRDKSLRA